MRQLETVRDGWRFAFDVLRDLEEAGPEKCRANLPIPAGRQCEALILALAELKERGTTESLVGFAQILTDLAGTRCELGATFYESMARAGSIRPFKLKRLVSRGNRLAVLAIRRECEVGQPEAAKPPEALTTP